MKELIENIDYYINKDGNVVLTEKYHLDKGYCCGNGCLHCPYQYENVPEPQQSELKSKNQMTTESHKNQQATDNKQLA